MNITNSIAVIAISLGLFFFFGKPAWSDVSALRAEKGEYLIGLEQVSRLEAKRQELSTKMDEISVEDRQKIERFLPTEAGLVKLISDIDGLASRHGISITAADIGEPLSDLSRSVAETAPPSAYKSKTLNLSFAASYENLQGFLVDLEKSLRLIDIRMIDVGLGSERSNIYNYKVMVEVYFLAEAPIETPSVTANVQ